MANEHLDNVTEIRLPAKFFKRSVGVAFDVGGSRCKVAFRKRAEQKTSDDDVSVVLAGFSRHRLADALEFVKQNADYSPQSSESDDENGRQRQLHITGVFYSRSFASTVETQLNLSAGSAVYVDEFAMEKNAINILLQNINDNDVFYPQPATPWTVPEDGVEKTSKSDDDTQPSINGKALTTSRHTEPPYLILSYGSATGITLVSKDGTSTLINGSPEGGVSLLALSKLLIGVDDFAEFMSLAERGNEAAVSITTGECQKELNEPSYFDKFPPNAVLHAFGNTLKPDFKGEKADMARAILMNAIQNVATMTVWSALAKDCQTVYLCGGVFEHQLPRDLFVYFFEGLSIFFGETPMKCRAVKHCSFLPVIGTVMDNCVSNNNQLHGSV